MIADDLPVDRAGASRREPFTESLLLLQCAGNRYHLRVIDQSPTHLDPIAGHYAALRCLPLVDRSNCSRMAPNSWTPSYRMNSRSSGQWNAASTPSTT